MKKKRRKKGKKTGGHVPNVAIKRENTKTPELPKEVEQSDATNKTEEALPWENPRVRIATEMASERWELYGMSVQGLGHVQSNLPCQDFHRIELLDTEKGIGVAVVSDGAGSKANSDKGSQLVCDHTVMHLQKAIKDVGWDADHLPDLATWNKVSRVIVQLLQNDLFGLAEKEQCSFGSLGATWLMLFFTPKKSYFAHIGDGRAGVLTQDGWKAILTPHKGEEANQTVFITNKVLEDGLTISGVAVPETVIIDEPINAFVLMSDGCEDGLWIKSKKKDLPDGDFKYIPMNDPFAPALNDILIKMQQSGEHQRKELFFNILDHYNKPLKNETDDKTICLGYTIHS